MSHKECNPRRGQIERPKKLVNPPPFPWFSPLPPITKDLLSKFNSGKTSNHKVFETLAKHKILLNSDMTEAAAPQETLQMVVMRAIRRHVRKIKNQTISISVEKNTSENYPSKFDQLSIEIYGPDPETINIHSVIKSISNYSPALAESFYAEMSFLDVCTEFGIMTNASIMYRFRQELLQAAITYNRTDLANVAESYLQDHQGEELDLESEDELHDFMNESLYEDENLKYLAKFSLFSESIKCSPYPWILGPKQLSEKNFKKELSLVTNQKLRRLIRLNRQLLKIAQQREFIIGSDDNTSFRSFAVSEFTDIPELNHMEGHYIKGVNYAPDAYSEAFAERAFGEEEEGEAIFNLIKTVQMLSLIDKLISHIKSWNLENEKTQT